MKSRMLKIFTVAFASGALGLFAACRKTETTTAAAATPAVATNAAETTTSTTTTTTTTAGLASADSAVITADPVVVSQRNATRRRAAGQSRTTSTREGRPGYSEERPPQEERRPSRAARMVPEGTILRVAFDEPISTATAKNGDTVRGRVLDDVLATDGSVAAASGSRVTGRVEHVVDSGKLGRPAELKFGLIELETRAGPVPIRTSSYERVGETHTKHNVEYIAGGAAVGAILGQVLGRDTGSTLKGAAAGAAVGTGVAAATGDLDFTIDAGRTVAFTLEEPLSIR